MHQIKMVERWDADELVALYRDAGWWKESYDPSGLGALVSGSLFFAVAVENGRAVGMGRVISDGVSDAYIQDIVVAKPHRSKGVGKDIVAALRNACVERGLSWIGLVAEPGTAGFYEPLGFSPKDGYTLMLYEAPHAP